MSAHGTLLGKVVGLPDHPENAVLETVPAPLLLSPTVDFSVRFSCPEFTSLCPVTGQPDFAHIVIDYVPRGKMVESKALKLFMGSFRNHGAFHEAVTAEIGARLWGAMDPRWLRVSAYWYPRGGIPIDVFWENCANDSSPPSALPPRDIPVYRAR